MTREELLVDLAARVLARPDERPVLVAVEGMTCSGKTTLAGDVADVLDGAGRPTVRVAYDDFHHPREVRYRQDRMSPEGYLLDAFDPESLLARVIEPVEAGADEIVTASLDLATDEPVDPDPVPVARDGAVVVDGSFLLAPQLAARWDLSVLLVADPAVILDRALVRDVDLGPPERVRELYLRRYLGAWALHEERHDPWSRADVVVDNTDPLQPKVLSG